MLKTAQNWVLLKKTVPSCPAVFVFVFVFVFAFVLNLVGVDDDIQYCAMRLPSCPAGSASH